MLHSWYVRSKNSSVNGYAARRAKDDTLLSAPHEPKRRVYVLSLGQERVSRSKDRGDAYRYSLLEVPPCLVHREISGLKAAQLI